MSIKTLVTLHKQIVNVKRETYKIPSIPDYKMKVCPCQVHVVSIWRKIWPQLQAIPEAMRESRQISAKALPGGNNAVTVTAEKLSVNTVKLSL